MSSKAETGEQVETVDLDAVAKAVYRGRRMVEVPQSLRVLKQRTVRERRRLEGIRQGLLL